MVGGVAYAARTAGSNGYGCLMTVRDGRPNSLLDLNTGLVARYRNIAGGQPRVELSNTSPNGQYVSYLKPGSVDRYTLIVEERSSGKITLAYKNAATAPLGMNNTAYVFWAPDSSRFAYLWSTGSYESSFVLITTPDGSQTSVIKGASSIGGWSKDNAYLAFSTWPDSVNGDYYLHLWSPTHTEVESLRQDRWFNAVWSPSGNRLAYLETAATTNQAPVVLNVVSPDKGLEVSFTLPSSLTGLEYGTPMWSPDARHIAMTYTAPTAGRHLDLYGIDGTAVHDVATALLSQWWRLWSDDGASLIFFEGRAGGTADWMVYPVADGRVETLLRGIDYLSNGNQRFVVSWRVNGKVNVDLIGAGSTARTSLIEGADSVDSVEWAPDWSRLIMLWYSGQGAARRERLTWSSTDGSAHQTLADAFERVWNLNWLGGGNAVAYLLDESSRTSAEMLDLQSGTRRRLLEGKLAIAAIPWPVAADQVAYHWVAPDGVEWINAFGSDGRLLYQFQTDHAVFNALYPSPDARVAVLTVMNQPAAAAPYGLILSSSDGQSARVIRDGLAEVTNVSWSPDGKMLAFTGNTGKGLWLLEVMTVDGQTIQRFTNSSPLLEPSDSLSWTGCS